MLLFVTPMLVVSFRCWRFCFWARVQMDLLICPPRSPGILFHATLNTLYLYHYNMDSRPQDIPVKKLITALLAISFGTIIEWVGESACGTALEHRPSLPCALHSHCRAAHCWSPDLPCPSLPLVALACSTQ